MEGVLYYYRFIVCKLFCVCFKTPSFSDKEIYYTSISCILTVRILTNRPYLNKKLECLFRDSLYNHVNFPAVS